MEIYDAGYTNGYWIQRKTSGCATSIVPDYFVFTFSQLVLILTSLISFFIGIRILYRYMRVEERKRGNGGNVVSVNKRFWISNRWKMELIAENLRLNFFSSFIDRFHHRFLDFSFFEVSRRLWEFVIMNLEI